MWYNKRYVGQNKKITTDRCIILAAFVAENAVSVSFILFFNLQRRSLFMNKQLNLQDVFLNQARKEKISITIYLTNGFQFKGMVKGFDSYIVILDQEGRQSMVYKHAISTIIPSRHISILDAASPEKAE